MNSCQHCGAPVAGERFCCHGCATAHALLESCGLGAHAALRQAAVAAGTAPRPVPRIAPETAGWADPAFMQRIGAPLADGTWSISWAVEGMHCPACTWVLERLPFLDPGVRRAEVDLGRGVLRTVHDPAMTDPARLAALAATLGYRLRPWAGAGEDARRQSASRALALRAAVAFACAVGAMQVAMNLAAGELTGDLDPLFRRVFGLGALLLALPAGTWAVWPWWRALPLALRTGRWSLDATAAVVVAVGLGASLTAVVQGSNVTYADAVAMFAALLLAGRLALLRTQDRLAVQASRLNGLLPEVPPEEGAEIRVASGARLPGDGPLIAAEGCQLDTAVLTGESRPQAVAVGQTVFAGCLVVAGSCTVRVSASGPRTRVATLLAAAESMHGRVTVVAGWERWYGPLLLVAALIAGWFGGVGQAVAVAMVACPCAIGLALPLARARVLAAARADGLLIRSGDALVRLRGIRRALFDKTGTLTTGRLAVTSWEWLVAEDLRPRMAAAIAAAERRCRHPVALAIERHLGDVPEVPVTGVVERPGRGLTAVADGVVPFSIAPDGDGGLELRWDGVVAARIRAVDGLRPDAGAAIAACTARGWPVAIASGDAEPPVREAAAALGIGSWHHGLVPEGKAALVDRTTLMVGDGVNDAAALAGAGVSVAVRGGLAAGLSCADVVVTDEAAPLAAVERLLAASDRLRRRERVLLMLTIGYNACAVTAALAGWWGPLVCAIGMPLSSLAAIVLATAWEPFPPAVPAQRRNQSAP